MTHHRFPRASRWRRGYHRRQVDHFLDRVEESLQGAGPPMAAAEIRRAGFELVRHGYAIAEVDAHLDALEERVLAVQSVSGGRRGRTDPDSDLRFLRDKLDQPYLRRFPRAGLLRRGYDIDQVDEFVDLVVARLDGAPEPTVDDVRAAGFKPRRGGYAEEAVDEMFDRVVEMLLVERRTDGPQSAWPDRPDLQASGPAG